MKKVNLIKILNNIFIPIVPIYAMILVLNILYMYFDTSGKYIIPVSMVLSLYVGNLIMIFCHKKIEKYTNSEVLNV
jgi:hypothetical protein